MDRLKSAALAAFMALASPAFAEWNIVKNEPDPFEPSKSTFIALNVADGGEGLGIRCLEGGLSLVVTNSASNAAAGDPAHLKIVVDSQPPREEDEAFVMSSTSRLTVVQFGGKETLGYLKGAKKVSVRYELGGVRLTNTFEGGKPMDDVIDKALNACGKSYRTTEDAQANDALVGANQTADWYYMDDNEDGAECHAMSSTPKQFADTAVRKGAANLKTTGQCASRCRCLLWSGG